MSEHTPGPWRYVPGDRGFAGNRDEPPEPSYPPTIWADYGDHEVRLLKLEDPVYMDEPANEYDDGVRLHGDTEANAHLIAAAPDLYALYEAVKAASVQRDPRHRISMLVNDWDSIEAALVIAECRLTAQERRNA